MNHKVIKLDMIRAGELRKLQISELEEIRNEAYNNAWITKSRTKIFHDQLINKNFFAPGRKVMLYHSRLHIFTGKLKSHWLGPFTVHTISPHGAIIIVDLKSGEKMKVNGQRLKPFLTTESQDENVMGLFDPFHKWQYPTKKNCK